MPDETIDFDEKTEVGGFNPERRNERKEQVGPAPTDDPRGRANPDLKHKIGDKTNKLPPG